MQSENKNIQWSATPISPCDQLHVQPLHPGGLVVLVVVLDVVELVVVDDELLDDELLDDELLDELEVVGGIVLISHHPSRLC